MRLLVVDEHWKTSEVIIDRSKKIGEGATASVFKVTFNNELWAAKIYKPERVLSKDKLEAMLIAPPAALTKQEGSQTFIQYTWVRYLLIDSVKGIVGFIMPFVDQQSTNSLDTYYDPVLIKRLSGNTQSALSLRLEIARNLCELIANLHNLGHHFIDIKPQNVRVYKDNNKVVLMDCDGYSIKNHHAPPDRFTADLISTDFIAPEVLKYHLSPQTLGEEQDRYGLAVILFQLLNRGTHPFQGIITNPSIQVSTNDERAALGLYPYGVTSHPSVQPRPQSIHDLLLPETRAMFDQAFTSLERPTASAWQQHFEKILDQRLLVRCKQHPNDVRHIHFKDLGCIGCKTDTEARKSKAPESKARPYKVKPVSVSPAAPSHPAPSYSPSSVKTASPSTSLSNSESWIFYPLVMFAISVFLMYWIKNTDINSNSSDNTTVNSTTHPFSATSSNGNQCQTWEMGKISNSDLCKYFWLNMYPQCDQLFLREFSRRNVTATPQSMCGTRI